jgi:hypothetical protein
MDSSILPFFKGKIFFYLNNLMFLNEKTTLKGIKYSDFYDCSQTLKYHV